MAADLPGTGELGNGHLKGDAYIDNISYNLWYTAMLIERSIAGIQAGDIVKLSRLLKQDAGAEEIFAIAVEEMAPALLHAAAFDPVISRVALIKPYSSYRSIVVNRFYDPRFVHSLVPGALKKYDLPDLAVSLAPRKLMLAGVTDCNGKYDDKENINKDTGIIKNAYNDLGAPGMLVILPQESTGDPHLLYNNWIK